MAQLSIFSGHDLPDAFAHQIRSFIRLHWEDPYVVDPDAALVPADRYPQHVVLAERQALISHARVIWVPFVHAGEVFRLYCLGDVFTYPAFRGRGLGGSVTAGATALIRKDQQADLAILFCDDVHASFYARHGWEPAPDVQAEAGSDGSRYRLEGLPMLLRLSVRGRPLDAGRSGPWQLPGHGW